MSNPFSSQSIPFTDVESDFLKLVNLPDSIKDTYIDYEASDFASMRQGIINYIQAVYPLDYNNFAESDLGMMLIEVVAYMGAVLSLKADMLANENFISTAKDRDSVRKLFELVGVSMKGPTSAQATVEVSVEGIDELTKDLTLSPSERVFTVVSPEDGESSTYTLYAISNGRVGDPESNASITYTSSLITSSTGVYSEAVLLEGSFAVESGQFSDVDVFKSISLTEAPVIQNSTQVYVSAPSIPKADGVYRAVDNLYQASSTNDKVFQVIYADDYTASIIFGDGNNGVSPPPGSTYTVTYRVGGGSRGNTPASYINAVGTGTYNEVAGQGIRVVQMSMATGGTDAETVEKAKRYAPLTFRRQDRLVSLEDYTAFASRFTSNAGSTGKGTASLRKAFSSANVIDLFILESATDTQLQKASISFKNDLLAAIDIKKMITDDVVVNDGLIRTVDLVITANVDKRFEGIEGTITPQIARRVQNYFLSTNRDFGEPLILADLNRAIFELSDVRYSSVDNLNDDIHIEFNEIIQLNNLVINISLV